MLIPKAILRSLLLGIACSGFFMTSAQIQHEGKPFGGPLDPASTEIPFIEMPKVNESELLKEDSLRREKGLKVLRFAKNIPVSIDIPEDGERSELRDGRVIHRIGIHSPGARSLNFGFSSYELTDGAKLFIYTPDKEKIIGSFTRANSAPGKKLATMPVPGDKAVIELIEPRGADEGSQLLLQRVSHAYRSVLEKGPKSVRGAGYGAAGNCNVNVNCPDGKPYRDQKRAVAMVIDNGDRLCSGALVNNTAGDGTPYFLTASHCVDNGGPPSGWVFVFNYESSECKDQPASTDQSLSGSILRARHEDSDFALVELVDTPPEAYGVFYAGWDRSGTTPDSSVSIHHPSGDIKKISFDDDSPDSAQFNTSIPNGEWQVKKWDRNSTTESGSSGAPLFDEDGLIVGQLHGGDATCENNVNDYFGRFSISWDRHAPVDSQLEHWLDPVDTNVTEWRGNDPAVGQNPYDAAVTSILSPSSVLCGEGKFTTKAEIRNLGSQSIDSLVLYLLLQGDTLEKRNWKGSISAGAYDTIVFSSHTLQDTSAAELIAGTRYPNGQSDPDPMKDRKTSILESRLNGKTVTMAINTDCYGAETFWELVEKENGNTLYRWPEGGYPGSDSYPNKGGHQETHTFCLNEGCYELQLHDSYGDGMNGSQYNKCDVNGELLIKGSDGQRLTELGDPDFGNDTTLLFCTDSTQPPTSPEDDSLPDETQIQVDPNPAPGRIRVQIDGAPGVYKLRVYDMKGSEAFYRKIDMNAYHFRRWFELSALSQGLYMLEIQGPFDRYRRKLTITR